MTATTKVIIGFFFSVFFLLCLYANSQSVIEGVIVETYYVSSAADNEPPFGGPPEGSVTYRVFLDLCENCKLVGLFGNENNPFKIASTLPWYNTELTGRLFGHQIATTLLGQAEVTVLDSYLSFGGASSSLFATPKEDDLDGSIWSSGTTPTGQLANQTSEMGSSLLDKDGLFSNPNFSSTLPNPFQAVGDAAPANLNDYFGRTQIPNNLN